MSIAQRLRKHPLNLIRIMPAQGCLLLSSQVISDNCNTSLRRFTVWRNTVSYGEILSYLLVFALFFSISGVLYARRHTETLESYIVARNTQGGWSTMLTLMASSLGAWILFAPAQAATWGGLWAIIGYGLGAMAPRFLMVPLGRRMRELIPSGHTLTEYVLARYGRPMYAITLLIMLFYMFISITAEITAMAKLVNLIAPVPLWLTALIVLCATLAYTAYGGLRASIFTDKVQMLVIFPLLVLLVIFGWHATNGVTPIFTELSAKAPELVSVSSTLGLKAGLTFLIALLLTGLFHQGNWQRIYAAQTTRAMRNGFILAGILVAPIIFIMGLFGLAFVAMGEQGDSSVAIFKILFPTLPYWFVVLLIPLGLALVMSSVDTAINAFSSLIVVDMRRLMPHLSAHTLMRLARGTVFPLAALVWFFSAKGYSVLYLFLLADLLCSAAAFPVFFGLFSKRYSGTNAALSTLAGLVAGLVIFPAPNAPLTYLLESFLLAAFVPLLVSWVLFYVLPKNKEFELTHLNSMIKKLS